MPVAGLTRSVMPTRSTSRARWPSWGALTKSRLDGRGPEAVGRARERASLVGGVEARVEAHQQDGHAGADRVRQGPLHHTAREPTGSQQLVEPPGFEVDARVAESELARRPRGRGGAGRAAWESTWRAVRG